MLKLFAALIITAGCLTGFAQPNLSPDASLTLTFSQEDGTNGIAVAYNPAKKIYYIAIAGNATFPLEAVSKTKNVYEGTTGYDARGLWYNEKENVLEGNAYDSDGIYAIMLDSKGLPNAEAENKYTGGQPEGQSVGVLDAGTGEILYFNNSDGTVTRYKRTSGKKGKALKLKGSPAAFEDLNNAMIYTGQKGYEIGLYDYKAGAVYLFDKKGKYKATVDMGDDAPNNEMFNFSYANGYIFLFDTDTKEWSGYKVF